MEKEVPPAYPSSETPGAGFRVPLVASSAASGSSWPRSDVIGPAPFQDKDGSPVYVGSAIVVSPSGKTSVQPGKANPSLPSFARYSYGGRERVHEGGQFDILPIQNEMMAWVEAEGGKIPKGARPVEGGYEEDGRHLFHALAHVDGIDVPGKVGEHFSGAHIPYGGREHIVPKYRLLVWR